MTERVDGAGYEFLGENFVAVPDGQPFARRGAETLTADGSFYPVLMSTDGYDESVGFAGQQRGPLSTVPDDG